MRKRRLAEICIDAPALRGFFVGSARPVGNTALAEIVRRKLNSNFVTAENTDVVFPHLAGDVCNDHMTVLQLYAKLRIRQVLKNRALHFNMLFFCHAIFWAPAR